MDETWGHGPDSSTTRGSIGIEYVSQAERERRQQDEQDKHGNKARSKCKDDYDERKALLSCARKMRADGHVDDAYVQSAFTEFKNASYIFASYDSDVIGHFASHYTFVEALRPCEMSHRAAYSRDVAFDIEQLLA